MPCREIPFNDPANFAEKNHNKRLNTYFNVTNPKWDVILEVECSYGENKEELPILKKLHCLACFPITGSCGGFWLHDCDNWK